MKIKIEAVKDNNLRVRYDESSLVEKSRHNLRASYPYEYGFIIGSGENGLDALDCFLVSNTTFKIGDVVECEPFNMFILNENEEKDIKLLAKRKDEIIEINSYEVKMKIESFLVEVFKEWPDVIISFSELLGLEHINLIVKEIKT